MKARLFARGAFVLLRSAHEFPLAAKASSKSNPVTPLGHGRDCGGASRRATTIRDALSPTAPQMAGIPGRVASSNNSIVPSLA
jgi:hypothetical protein